MTTVNVFNSGIHKHYSVDEWVFFATENPHLMDYVAASSGTSDADFEKIAAIIARVPIKFICLDVANGYSEHVNLLMYFLLLF